MLGSAFVTFGVGTFPIEALWAVLWILMMATVFLGRAWCRPLDHCRTANVFQKHWKMPWFFCLAVWLNSASLFSLFFYPDLYIAGSKTACLVNESEAFDRCCVLWRIVPQDGSCGLPPPNWETALVEAGGTAPGACHCTAVKWYSLRDAWPLSLQSSVMA